ncbi:MAG TPA: hypothetical protein VFU22_12335, partial [Roseiflexaceae bacterium]|nr:hypothetical protein [Roseiflexaceae bacterium]
MRIHRFLAATLVALLVSVFGSITPQQAAAANDNLITIAITATVAVVDDHANLLGGAIQPGDTVTGTYTYNAATSDTNASPNVGDYWHTTAPYGISLKVGGRVFETDPQNVSFLVEVVNNLYDRDNYLLRSYNNRPLSNGLRVTHIAWQLDDTSQTALKSAALPRTAPRLNNWQSLFGLTMEGSDSSGGWGDNQFFVRAHVTQAQKITR